MRKQWAYYIFYKSYKVIAAGLIILFLNYSGEGLIDWFHKLFRGMGELQSLIATSVLTLAVAGLIFFLLYRAAIRLRRRIFKTVPVKPNTPVFASPETAEVKPVSPNICRCPAGSYRDMIGAMRFILPDGNEAHLSMNVMKHESGSGILRSACKIAGKVQAVTFRINYCPNCGGRFLAETDDNATTNNSVDSKNRTA